MSDCEHPQIYMKDRATENAHFAKCAQGCGKDDVMIHPKDYKQLEGNTVYRRVVPMDPDKPYWAV